MLMPSFIRKAPRRRRAQAANIPEMRRVVVTGATGLIGTALVRTLLARGDAVIALTRDRQRAAELLAAGAEVVVWTEPIVQPPPTDALAGADAVVHLLGESLSQRWSEDVKQRIRQSRELGTRNLVGALLELGEGERPGVLVSQSAVGYYGALGEAAVDESAPAGSDFLADVVQRWETEALAGAPVLRVVVMRTGMVLARGGALAKMLPVFRLGLGGPVSGGRQYVSWVHLADVVGAIALCLDDERASGPINVTSPAPVDNAGFSHALGHVLHRPAALPVPAFALSVLYGEMSELVTTGQRAIPAKLTELGYTFAFPELEPALADVLSGRPGR
jgi:uncharacterized protein (TIGR01777 family)